jgi:hypothetical protein
MAVLLEEAVEQLRERIAGGATRLAIVAPPGFGKSAMLDRLAETAREHRRVVRVSFPQGDDAALAALVDVATGLGVVEEVVPLHDSARLPWATRLDLARKALAGVGDELLLLIDEPRFDATNSLLGELFAQRAAELTEMLLGVRKGAIVLAGRSIPIGVAERAGFALPTLSAPESDAVSRLGGDPLSPVVRQVLGALAEAGIDVERMPPGDLRLDRLVAVHLGNVLRGRAELLRTIAHLSAIRVPFSKELVDQAGVRALSAHERTILNHLLVTVDAGRTCIVPAVLAQVIRAQIVRGSSAAWALDEPSGDAHRFAARYHRARFEAAKARADVGAAVREELEEIHQLTEAGDAAALLDRSLQFVEQYDALGKSLSLSALRAPREQREKKESLRRDAVRAYERAIGHDDQHAYAHHYIAYNLDILGIETERVEREYVAARKLEPGHPWYHARYIGFLVTTGWMKEAREAWDRALGDLTDAMGPLPPATYEELHAQVARVLLSRSELDFAADVLDDVPDALRAKPWWVALHQLHVCLEEDRDERLVFPPRVALEDRWKEGPHLIATAGELLEVARWRPGRVIGRDKRVVVLQVAERDPGHAEAPLSTQIIEVAALREEWSCNAHPEFLVVGAFVELIDYRDGTKALKIGDKIASSFDAIPYLPKLFPSPTRYIRRAFA